MSCADCLLSAGPDPIVSALLQKMHRLEAKEGGSVHGSVMGGGGGADGDKARGMPIGDLHAMLVRQSLGPLLRIRIRAQGI